MVEAEVVGDGDGDDDDDDEMDEAEVVDDVDEREVVLIVSTVIADNDKLFVIGKFQSLIFMLGRVRDRTDLDLVLLDTLRVWVGELVDAELCVVEH